MTARVFLASLDAGYKATIAEGLQFIDFGKLVGPQGRVFIKPNLTFPYFQPGVMTSPEAVEAAILAIAEYTPHICIGDSDAGGYNRFSMDQVYKATGLLRFAGEYGVQVINLSHVPRQAVEFQYGRRRMTVDLPRLLIDEIDLLVTMPVPKMHTNSGVSLTFKNQWGCIPEPSDRLRLHPHLKYVLVEVNRAVKARVAIVDGKYGLNVNGPMRGCPVDLNWVLVANDIGAGARLTCELMQIHLDKIQHLSYAAKLGLVPDLDAITLNQDWQPFLQQKFFLKREWTDYPGYLAFRSPFLAYLAYFSPLAPMLHRALYLFRQPFYEYR